MKKVVCILLLAAMLFSCVTLVSAEEETGITTVLESDFDTTTVQPDGSQYWQSIKKEIVDSGEEVHGNVMKFTATNANAAYFWTLGTKIKEFASKNANAQKIIVSASMDIKIEKGANTYTKLMLKAAPKDIMLAQSLAEVGKWTVLSGTKEFSAEEILSASDGGFRFMYEFINLDNGEAVVLVDNLKVQIKAVSYGVKISGTANGNYMRFPDFGKYLADKIANAENGEAKVDLNIYNTGTKNIAFKVSAKNGWGNVLGESRYVIVYPGYYETVTLIIPVKDGKVLDGENAINASSVVLYIEPQDPQHLWNNNLDGAEYIFACPDIDRKALENAGTNGRMVENVESIPNYGHYSFITMNLDSGKTLDMNYYANFVKEPLVKGSSGYVAAPVEIKLYRGGELVKTLAANSGSSLPTGFKYTVGTYADIAPQSMADEITAELVVGGKVIATKTESIKSYCEKVLKTADGEKYRTFMADMLVYGQALSDYKNLGKTIVGENDAWIATSKTDFATIKGELQSVKSATTATDTNNKIKSAGLYFYDINKIYFRAEINGGVVKINGTEVDGNNGKYYTDGIAATKFADVYTVTAEVDGAEVHKVTYSVNSYVLAKCEGDAAINVLARALGCYGYSATQLS